jgi:hyperosmotically inducible periplasmic protein
MKVWLLNIGLAGALAWGAAAGTAAVAASDAKAGKPAIGKSHVKSADKDRSAGQVITDVTITGKVKSALMQDKKVEAREINVDTANGVVHLRGNVDSKAEAQRAAALAKKVDGVKGVMSHLKIVPNEKTAAKGSAKDRSLGHVLSDVTITGKVKSALMQDKKVEAREINVDTVKGVVHLRGNVDSKGEVQRAVALAKKVDGVKGVKSHLKIVPNDKKEMTSAKPAAKKGVATAKK